MFDKRIACLYLFALMTLWKVILSAMLYLQAPGKSIYSLHPSAEGAQPVVTTDVNGTKAYALPGSGEELPTQCLQKHNPACYYPRLRDVSLNGQNIKTAWMRPETYDEGVVRYALIAQAIHQVVGGKEWSFPREQLWRFLVAIANHESGFRRDIHSGFGSAALGDCSMRKTATGKLRPVPGTCRSFGLFQTLFPSAGHKHFGFTRKDVVGVDRAATVRAATLAATHLDGLYRMCERRKRYGARGDFVGCIFAAYGGVRSSGDPRIQARIATYKKAGTAPAFGDYVRSVLASDENTSSKIAVKDP